MDDRKALLKGAEACDTFSRRLDHESEVAESMGRTQFAREFRDERQEYRDAEQVLRRMARYS